MEYRNKRVDLEFENNIQYWQLVLFLTTGNPSNPTRYMPQATGTTD